MKINILIVRSDLDNLGVDQEGTYLPLYFPESSFHGFWLDSSSEQITFYVGPETFICRNCKKNIDLFNSMIPNNN